MKSARVTLDLTSSAHDAEETPVLEHIEGRKPISEDAAELAKDQRTFGAECGEPDRIDLRVR
ncbi:MAG: hypothetical protein CL820_10680 [Croceicoccus sp.]|jgi:hypothetical protein|nr:hypothetical protein WG75_09585 [Citromicrobium sp. WPS32]MAF29531.1 hypothetical protein [Croceicoccus sp.]MAK97594.1 hypothetical protein [Citromicrobium sp.]MAS85201.1 hypothetical protein [Erythrobacteraceae bacterium]HAG38211.1 hypothetical protein [Erythrobacter sp.]|tara:strand:- start:1921 stop:2106 length:186 start_codon:yes stop_codon:yes gene_type:complete